MRSNTFTSIRLRGNFGGQVITKRESGFDVLMQWWLGMHARYPTKLDTFARTDSWAVYSPLAAKPFWDYGIVPFGGRSFVSMKQSKIGGIFPALLTPFTKGGAKVDYERACGLAEFLAKKGVHGLFVCGTTGEGPLMTLAERKKMVEEVVGAVGKKLTVIAHTGCFDTASTIELTQHAQKAGAAAAGVVTPGFFTFDDECLYTHFKTVAESVKGFPILLYNIPGCVKNVIKPSLVHRLAKDVKNIIGMKDSGGNMSAFNEVMLGVPKGFVAINGVDEYSMQALAVGGAGCVSSTANVVPELFLAIYNSMKKGNLDKAWESQQKLCRACAAFHYGALVARYKEGVRLRGYDPGYVRAPQRELTKDERKELAKSMKAAGLI